MKRYFIGVYNLANCVTYLGIAAAVEAAVNDDVAAVGQLEDEGHPVLVFTGEFA